MDAAFMLFKRHESGIHAVRIHLQVRTISHANTLTAQQHQQHRIVAAASPGPDAPARADAAKRFHDREQFWANSAGNCSTIMNPRAWLAS